MHSNNSQSSNKPARSQHSIRLFDNNALEALSHVHPIVPLLLWSPLVAFLLYRNVHIYPHSMLEILGIALIAALSWTFTEYFLHRYIFHFIAHSSTVKNLVFTFHGVHHSAPLDKTRLVMPPAGALIFMGLFWLLFEAVLPASILGAFFAFFVASYLVYDYIHYAIHHFPMKNPVGRYLKAHHLQHHFKTPHRHYGVSSPLWDIILRTH